MQRPCPASHIHFCHRQPYGFNNSNDGMYGYVMYEGCCWYCSTVLRWDKLQLHLAATTDGRLWCPAIHPRCSTAEKPICELCWCFVSFIFALYFLLASSRLPDIVRFCIWSSCPHLLRVALGPPENFLGFTAFFHQDVCIIALMENPSRVTNTLWTRNQPMVLDITYRACLIICYIPW